MNLKFKRLHPNAVLPSRAHPTDAGLDLTSVSDYRIVLTEAVNKGQAYYIEYDTGIAVEIPEGHVGLIFPRSSISKTALMLANAVGVVDCHFTGEIKFRFKLDAENRSQVKGYGDPIYKKGDRIGQLIVLPYPKFQPEWVDELSSTDRGSKGFGSSGW